ncbi:hypothetical protein OH77DRAFT_985792 [Trametes cingulata]|nr:hypothetical protein OH77DRAFT_985792 [Trametes cingulata]
MMGTRSEAGSCCWCLEAGDGQSSVDFSRPRKIRKIVRNSRSTKNTVVLQCWLPNPDRSTRRMIITPQTPDSILIPARTWQPSGSAAAPDPASPSLSLSSWSPWASSPAASRSYNSYPGPRSCMSFASAITASDSDWGCTGTGALHGGHPTAASKHGWAFVVLIVLPDIVADDLGEVGQPGPWSSCSRTVRTVQPKKSEARPAICLSFWADFGPI